MQSKPNILKFIIPSALGVYLEFMEFTLYAYASRIIAYKFFPEVDGAINYAWLIFAAGFGFRLFGTILFGHIGDRFGVKPVLKYSILLMALATIGIGLLPTYNQIGIWAPISLFILRSIQGFAVSPEYNSIATYLSYFNAYKKRFCLFSSVTVTLAGLGMITGGMFMAFMTKGYVLEFLPEWRWRLPFVLSGVVLGFITFILRRNIENKTPETIVRTPLLSLIKTELKELVLAILLVGCIATVTYTLSGYLTVYLQTYRNYELSDALGVVSKYSLVLCTMTLLSGYLADKVGKKTIIRISLLAFVLCMPVIFYLISYESYYWVSIAIFSLSLLLGFISGVLPAYLATSFSEEQRYTGSSIAYNYGMAIFGGITPWFMTKIVSSSSIIGGLYPGLIIALFALILFLSFCFSSSYKNKSSFA